MTKKEKDYYQKGLDNAAEFLRLFIMPKCTLAWDEDELIGQRELNEVYAELADKIQTLELDFFIPFSEKK